jgi:hypothetical protein
VVVKLAAQRILEQVIEPDEAAQIHVELLGMRQEKFNAGHARLAKQIRMRVWRFSQGVEFGSLKLLDMGAGRSRRVWHSAQHGKEAAEEFGQKLDFRAVGFAALVF